MNGIEQTKKLAMVGSIYFSVAVVVAIGFTLRGAEVQARNEASVIPAQHLAQPVADSSVDEDQHLNDSRDVQLGEDIGSAFNPGNLVEPALDLIARHAVRRVVL